MMKVLITGCAGFIGSNLCKLLLQKGYQVSGIDNLSAGTLQNIPEGVNFYQLDIRDKAIHPIFEGIEVVFHLAAKNCLVDCLQNPLETSDINVTGTVNVLEASRLSNVRKVIYADTSAEYEGNLDFPSKEEHVSPIGVYAVAKRGGALFAETYSKLFNMNVTILRYFNVYGPAQDYRRVIPPVMSAFIIKLLNGEAPIIYGSGEKRRDFIYVDDVNEFHFLVMNDDKTNGKVYNVGYGVNYSINEIFNLIEEQLQTRIKPIFKDDLPGEAEITLADISKAKALGWEPKCNIREGIGKSIIYLEERIFNEGTFVSSR